MKYANIFALCIVLVLGSCTSSKGPRGPFPGEPTDKEATVTRTGLAYIELVEGTGSTPAAGATVKVHYTGYLKSGKQFDSSRDRGEPLAFQLGVGRVIKGWDEGIATMKVGGKRKLIIPQDLAYGQNGVPGLIPPYAELVFDVELVGVE